MIIIPLESSFCNGYRSWTLMDEQILGSLLSSKPSPLRGHSVLSWPSSTSSLPRTASGTPPSPWKSSSISCSPALPARDAHRAAPSLRPRERSSRAYSKNAASMSLCAAAGQGEHRDILWRRSQSMTGVITPNHALIESPTIQLWQQIIAS